MDERPEPEVTPAHPSLQEHLPEPEPQPSARERDLLRELAELAASYAARPPRRSE